jgi:hypothetical protein
MVSTSCVTVALRRNGRCMCVPCARIVSVICRVVAKCTRISRQHAFAAAGAGWHLQLLAEVMLLESQCTAIRTIVQHSLLLNACCCILQCHVADIAKELSDAAKKQCTLHSSRCLVCTGLYVLGAAAARARRLRSTWLCSCACGVSRSPMHAMSKQCSCVLHVQLRHMYAFWEGNNNDAA